MPTVNEVIKYLNEKAGLHYRLNSKQTIDKIKARLNEGYTQVPSPISTAWSMVWVP